MKKIFLLYIGLIAVVALPAQNVGIGTSTPTANLHVNGTLKITNGTQGAGKILTSDAAGLASWQPPPSPPSGEYVPAIGICCQSWMTKNLDVDTYRNGDPIPHVTNGVVWETLTTGAYCYYNNDSSTYAATYGKLYNWYAINDPRGLAPEGWHVATHFEWMTLGDCLGGDSIAGGHLKETGITHWEESNIEATNITGFTGLPGGYRVGNGTFLHNGIEGYWWTSTEFDVSETWYRGLNHSSGILYNFFTAKNLGFSVRVIKD